MIELQEYSNINTAKPFYLDKNDEDGIINNVKDMKAKAEDLKNGIEQIDNKYKEKTGNNLWPMGESHNLKYGIYFRGQSAYDDYELLPSIGRRKQNKKSKYTDIQERNMFHRFRRRSYSHLNRVLTEWEALFLARHHELPTRLLDWTSNLLIALYWACCSNIDEKAGEVWSFVRQPDEDYDLNVFDAPLCSKYEYAKEFKFLVKGIKVIYPFYVDPRMVAQGGIFTIQDNPWMPIHEYSPEEYHRKCFDIFHIRRWKIPKGNGKRDILDELNDVGINRQTLYPDLEGLSKGIPEIEDRRNKS